MEQNAPACGGGEVIVTTTAVIGVVVIGAFLVAVAQGDDILDGLESALSGALAAIVGTLGLTLALLGDLGGLIASAPEIASSVVIGLVGSAAIGGYVDLAAPAFATVALFAILGGIALREAT